MASVNACSGLEMLPFTIKKNTAITMQTVKIDGQEVRIPRRLVKAAQAGLIDVEQF